MTRAEIARLREQYPPGTQVELIEMNDPYTKLPPGLTGVVEFVDDAGDIHIAWSNGSGLAAIPGVDRITVVGSNPARKVIRP